jgi:N-sulfoglucosamine sulfohydrolase
MDRRRFLKAAAGGTVGMVARAHAGPATRPAERPNVLFITADDMNWDSVGAFGCQVADVTPNIDRLAGQGIRFEHAHLTIAVCQPCRESFMTGRYPHRNGALGFEPIHRDVPTLSEQLHAAGYLTGIFGKNGHYAPADRFFWDVSVTPGELGAGRDPHEFHTHATEFLANAKAAGKPFFLHANSADPHRPFPGSQQEKAREDQRGASFPQVSRVFGPEEVTVPAFLPDIPDVRKEVAQYFAAVHRCDETVGQLLLALEETGFAENTIVLFLSDNGMAFPYAKTNVYLNSTKTPLIVRWPGRAEPGSTDGEHFVSAADIMPTLLEALGVPEVAGMDGRSFLPLLVGGQHEGRDHVFTVFNKTSANKGYPMRCVRTAEFSYIYNAWADGETEFRNESQSGLTMKAMRAAGETDLEIAERVRFFLFRAPEEFYRVADDPNELRNLIDEPQHAGQIETMRRKLATEMERTEDPLLETFRTYLASRTP